MDKTKSIIKIDSNGINLFKTFSCGQCFRFEKTEENVYCGVAFDRVLKVQQVEDKIYIEECDEILYNNVWKKFFSLDTDYNKIDSTFPNIESFNEALEYSSGIRILRQDPLETIISFIISQNNNIPRIKKIINSFCENFGDKIITNDNVYYTFPKIEQLKNVTLEDLDVIKSGFRAKYIFDAIQKISTNEVDINLIDKLDYETAKSELLKIKGIGNKVADCILLFAYAKFSAFPQDVWINRIMDKMFDGKNGKELFGEYAGIAQQYLFYYAREKNI